MHEASRERNILDDGICSHEEVRVVGLKEVYGKIIGADFEQNMIQIEINIPAGRVQRVSKEDDAKAPVINA